MAEETGEKKAVNGKQATIGDSIQIIKGEEKGKKGKVVTVRENSVIAEIGKNPKKDEPIKTVVNHKNYKIIK
ncbi:hypothetical protein WQ57_08530 [Mesobacillus campisalis]|uniref:DUF2187 domain-containing protein n=1 Tax=Mesobacillus campisalis TaxID=1408103 RepID=A0A0M2T1C2_9BACI|nr:DUF2187 family protein [Mesobacillus campisalis]KKK38625.1 hypothetical protein WQ57_08530 [Mesobacillus campisalis]